MTMAKSLNAAQFALNYIGQFALNYRSKLHIIDDTRLYAYVQEDQYSL